MTKWAGVIGVIFGLVAAWLVYDYGQTIKQEESGAPYLQLQPGITISKGSALPEGSLVSVVLPESFSSMASFAMPDSPQNRSWIMGRPASQDIDSGSLILFEHFTDSPSQRLSGEITPGLRAMSIKVNPATAVAFFIEPGSWVDIIGTFKVVELMAASKVTKAHTPAYRAATAEGNGADGAIPMQTYVSRTLMQNVKVLAVGGATSQNSYRELAAEGYGTITLEVSPSQAEVMAFALPQIEGELIIVLRNPGDQKQVKNPRVDWEALSTSGE
jgi:Flp pilus assembly protein CpaB